MKTRSRARRGFTLVEILLVLGIIVMLAGITTVILWPQAAAAKNQIAKAALVKIEKQLDLYNINIGHYPTDEEGGLNALVTRPSFSDDKMGENWHGPYLSTDDLKDPWSNAWHYELQASTGSTDQKPFKLWSNGKDGMDGTEDDVKNWSDTTP